MTIGIPEIVSTDFEEEFMRRIGIYLEAMDLSAPTLDEAKSAYDRFISFPGTDPQDPDRIKNIIQNVRFLSKSHEK